MQPTAQEVSVAPALAHRGDRLRRKCGLPCPPCCGLDGPLPDPPPGTELSLNPTATGPEWRNFWGSSISVGFQPWDTVGFTLGAFTFSNQLDAQSRYIFPLFNRNTVVSIDMSVDVESFFNNLSPSKTKPKEKS